MHETRRIGALWPLFLAVALAIAACSDADGDGSGASTTVGATTSTDSSVTSTTTGATTSTDSSVTSTTDSSVPSTTGAGGETVTVFFGGEIADDCSPVLEFERTVVAGSDPMLAAFEELVGGPTAAEEADGAQSMFGPDSAGTVRSATFTAGLLVLDFDDFSAALANASTSCGSESLLAQLNNTAFQFAAVQRVEYRFAGSCSAFYEWLQRGCATVQRPTGPPDSNGGSGDSDGTPFSSDTSARIGDSVGDQSGQLVAVRMARQEGFDRFVLEVDGDGTPQYWVEYVERPVLDIPGDEVEVEGAAVLRVTIFPARRVDIEDPDFTPTYEGSLRIRSDTTNIVEAVFVSDFEATMEWVLGMRDQTGFEVFTLTNPPRLVVDVSHD